MAGLPLPPHQRARGWPDAHQPLARDPEKFRKLFDDRRDLYIKAEHHIQADTDDAAAIVAEILKFPIFSGMAAWLRRQALQILRAALKAADPYLQAVLRHLRLRPKAYQNKFVIGAGKASAQMARAVERMLGARITAGEINVKDGHGAKLRRIKINECGHPIPDQRGVNGARRIA